MQVYHEVRDAELLATLTASMERDGWVGAPLVAWGEDLITGSHRYVAATALDLTVPTVQIEDLFADAGLDFAAECECAGVDDINSAMLVYVVNELPAAIRAEYGIDLH